MPDRPPLESFRVQRPPLESFVQAADDDTEQADPLAALWDRLLIPGAIATAAAIPRVGRQIARGLRKLIPASAMRTAAEAGVKGGEEAAEFKRGYRGQPLTSEITPAERTAVPPEATAGIPQIGAARQLEAQQQLAAQRAAEQARLAPYGQAGRAIGGAPGADPWAVGGAAMAGGPAAGAAVMAASPQIRGMMGYGLGAVERGLKSAKPLSRAGIAAAAGAFLGDADAKREATNDEVRTVRAATRPDAGSDTLVKANAIIERITGPKRYMGTDAGQVTNGARATAVQTPSPGEASGSEQAQAAREAAAQRLRQQVQPSAGRAFTPEAERRLHGAIAGGVMGGPVGMAMGAAMPPERPSDIGMELALGPAGKLVGPAARIGTAAAGFLMDPSEAQAGAAGAVKKAAGFADKLWEKLLEEGKAGIRAYHGSPHEFEKFSTEHIGAGEGAQSFGHGLYFAEKEDVAKGYKYSTSDLKDFPIVGENPNWRVPSWVGKTIQSSPRGIDDMISTFEGHVREAKAENHWNVGGLQDIVDALKAVKEGRAELKKPGHMYEVNISAKPEQFLDWDKPLSEQSPHVQSILSEAVKKEAYSRAIAATSKSRADELWAMVKDPNKAPVSFAKELLMKPEFVKQLREAGIPGIRYFDQGSRMTGEGSRNYVVFDDKLVDILKRYGLAGLVAGGAYNWSPDQAQAGALDVVRKGVSKAAEFAEKTLQHPISKVKLDKPLEEMQATYRGTPAAGKQVTPADLQGGLLLPMIGDRSLAGRQLTGVGGTRFQRPVELQGGPGYMSERGGEGAIWAAGKGIAPRIQKNIERLAGGGQPIFLPYTAMGERSIDFSHHVSDAISEMLRTAKVPKNAATQFDKLMNTDSTAFKAAVNWPGVMSPKLREYLAGASGDIRNKFAKLMDTRKFQDLGFPSVAEARHAVTDPRLLHETTGASGIEIGRAAPGAERPAAQHRTYAEGLPGTYVGGFGASIPKELMYPDIINSFKKMGFKPVLFDYLMSRSPKGAPIAQRATQKWVDDASKFLRSKGVALSGAALAALAKEIVDQNELAGDR